MNEKQNVEKLEIGKAELYQELDGIYKSKENLEKFLSHIYPPKAVERTKRFVYRIQKFNDKHQLIAQGEYGVRFNDDKSKQASEVFKVVVDKIKKSKPTEWKNLFTDALESLDDATQQDFIQMIFIPKVLNPAAVLSGNNGRYGSIGSKTENAYKLLGRCMVFYAGKCVSKLTDIDTEISKEKFQEILQGCFGAAPNEFGENETFLSQFENPRAKLMIDAAKCALDSVRQNGDVDNEVEESYFNSLTSLLPLLAEAEEESIQATDFIEVPKKVDDFVRDDANKALIQAKNIAKKYSRQYKIWFDKLEAAFNDGLKEEQEKERRNDTGEYENPLTGKKEKRHGKAWGTGGPNGFIRDNEYLQKMVNDIKGQSWNMFNCGPKIIFGIFDAIEHGGKIYQKLCDDLGEGFNQVKHSFNKTSPKDFDKLIKNYKKEGKGNEAYSASMASVICALTSTYQLLGQGKIGTINVYHKTITTNNTNNTTVIQNSLNNLQDALEMQSREESDYERWKKEKAEEIDEKIKKYEDEIRNAENNKPTAESTKRISIARLLKEAEEKKKQSDIEKEIDEKKEELEKLKNSKGKKLKVDLDSYFALLDGYAQAVSHEPEIANIYEFMQKMFDADKAKEQEAKIYNKEQENKESNDEQEEKTESVLYKLDIKNPLLNEAEDIDPNEEGNEPSTESKPQKTEDKKEKSTSKRGNLDWIDNGAGESFVKLYKLFGENTDSVHLDLSKIKSLSKDDNQESVIRDFGSMCKDLRNTLNNIDIRPITDGIIAYDYAFGEDADKAKFNTLANAFNIDGFEELDKEKKPDKKEEKKDGEFTKEELTAKYSKLLELTTNNSRIMKIVSGLNDIAKQAKDDSWLDTYNKLVDETNAALKEIWDVCLEMYPENNENTKKGHKWLLARQEDSSKQVLLNRIWYTLSCAKHIGKQVNGILEKNKNENVQNISNDNRLDEAKGVKKCVNTLYNSIENIDFSFTDLLPTDIGNELYNIANVDKYNELEKNLANRMGMKGDTDSNHIYPVCRTIVLTDNPVSKAIKAGKAGNCKKLANTLMSTGKSKGATTQSDRDLFLLYGLIRGLAVCMHENLNDELKETDCGNGTPLEREGEKTTAGSPENQSYIPGYSKDSLINEIYKYIKG